MGFNNYGENSGCQCKGCERRTVTCHGVCREYQNWKKKQEVLKETRDAERQRMDTMSTAKKKAIWKKMRYNRRGPKNTHREG